MWMIVYKDHNTSYTMLDFQTALSSMGSVQSNNSIFKSQVGVTGTSSNQSSNKIAFSDVKVDDLDHQNKIINGNAVIDLNL
ncbi:hypothetical protein PPL_09307 [Heterostelium album PN500]|uniref:Uncharacterized protein n=1 Tax=Heterostelium pallidum (strain ATCC 26659 / Pp 5 / PN500) TaxID=670386 RepID=D3BL75_HETP5|nr:hypothetical protein PPL_09307 [Heterostelium album PN500]EFA77809.1 hypothetical protein PPL_09307 [Heterostelium album PN500]|eukprot:XP_020429937.1 hypothetical protein PPL_09307 [Heterostelium album PN500]